MEAIFPQLTILKTFRTPSDDEGSRKLRIIAVNTLTVKKSQL